MVSPRGKSIRKQCFVLKEFSCIFLFFFFMVMISYAVGVEGSRPFYKDPNKYLANLRGFSISIRRAYSGPTHRGHGHWRDKVANEELGVGIIYVSYLICYMYYICISSFNMYAYHVTLAIYSSYWTRFLCLTCDFSMSLVD